VPPQPLAIGPDRDTVGNGQDAEHCAGRSVQAAESARSEQLG
jgi:hypothetical protein